MRLTARTLALTAVAAAGALTTPAHAQRSYASTPAPAAAPAAAEWNGIYRLTLTSREEGEVAARVLVERVDGAVDGTLLVSGGSTALTAMRADGDELRARVRTSKGEGTLVLRRSAGGVVGTLTVGQARWEIAGARSS